MKHITLKIIIIAVVLVLFTSSMIAKEPAKEIVLSQKLVQSLEIMHYNPPKLDNNFSQKVFQHYLKSLDPNKRFFLKSDVEKLKQFENKLDDELIEGMLNFYNLSWDLFQRRVEEVNRLTQDILKKPFNFQMDESFETDPQKRDYANDMETLKEQWRLNLKYQTLLAYYEIVSLQKDSSKDKANVNLKLNYDAKIENQARDKVAGNLKRSFERLLKEDEDNKLDIYLNSFANTFDPHTEYFPPQRKEDFDIDMTGTLEGIGASLREDGDYIKVAEIIPGSAAWRQKELQAGDIILKVAQGDGEPVDVVSMPVNDAVKLIRGKKGTEVRLTVKKLDGQIVVIPIVRDIVIIEETYAKSAIISNGKTHKKYGYIYLPSFYIDYKTNSRSSSEDVHQELIKLNSEKVDGVILDLRNNGGGSLGDAIEMSGLFIKDGPVVQVKDSAGRKEVYNDPDLGIDYNGPLVVLINSFSASASEILAAALQDYQRAIIVGGPDSFGKGTVQLVLDMNRVVPDSLKPAGSLKFTIQKFYRINGGSTQWKGVTADIPLPDLYGYLGVGEKKLDNSMPWDTISALPYKKWNSGSYKLSNLKKASLKRVKTSKAFKMIDADIARIKKQQENTNESLKFSNFLDEQNLLKQEAERLKNLPLTKPSYIKIMSPRADRIDSTDPNYQKMMDWYKQVGKDVYIDEAWHILEDMAK